MIAYIILAFFLTDCTKHNMVHVHSCCCKQQFHSLTAKWYPTVCVCVCVCVCVHTISYLFICWWTPGLLPYLGYCNNAAVNTDVLISFCLLALFTFSSSESHCCLLACGSIPLYRLICYWFLLVYFLFVIIFFVSGSSLYFIMLC